MEEEEKKKRKQEEKKKEEMERMMFLSLRNVGCRDKDTHRTPL